MTRVCTKEQARELLTQLHTTYHQLPPIKRLVVRDELFMGTIFHQLSEIASNETFQWIPQCLR